MSVHVVPYSSDWPHQFHGVARRLEEALRSVPIVGIEHVGSTSVPGLAAKPIIDVDVIVRRDSRDAAMTALAAVGYEHRGNLGLVDRDAFSAPDESPPRNVYLCIEGTLHLRNHLAVRDALRSSPDLRDRYGAVKVRLANDREMDIDRYTIGKSAVLQEILALSELTAEEKRRIYELNTRAGGAIGHHAGDAHATEVS